MNKRKVPKIRFKGFYDDWEQRKFSDLVLIERGGSPRPIDAFITDNPNGLNWVKIGDAPEQGRYITKTAEKIRPEGLSKTREVHPGDLILSNSMSFGKPYIMGVDGCIHDGWLLIRDTQKRFDLKFLCHMLGTDQMLNQYRAFAAGSTVNNLNKELVGNTTVTIPSLEEQQVLGQYFENLDHLITLHQRKLEKLKIIKKSMLENCFPKNGAKVPKTRFSEFSDDWEQRKLGDIYVERNERGNTELDILSVSIHHGISKNELGTDELGKSVRRSDDKSLYKHVYYGDLVFNMMRAWQGAIGVARNEGMVSPAYISAIPNGSIFPEYMDYCLCRKCIINQINNLSYGVTDFRKRLYWEPFTRVTIMMPSVDEQRKITDVLSRLDHLITLHQSKLEKLKMIKKSMLETMFV